MPVFRHIFAFTVLPLLMLSVGYSYYRFILEKDYLVGYDAACEPLTQSCYVWCEDETCEEPEYYAFAERYASDLFELCGDDVTGCEAATTCTPEEEYCSITFCDAEAGEECDTVVPALPEEESVEFEKATEETLEEEPE